MRHWGLIGLVLLLAACEKQELTPMPTTLPGHLSVRTQQDRLNTAANHWLDGFDNPDQETLLNWWKDRLTQDGSIWRVDATLPDGVAVKGWIDMDLFSERIHRFDVDTSQDEVLALCRAMEDALDIGIYYDGAEEPECRIGFGPIQILNLYDDYWSWIPVLVFYGGSRMSYSLFLDNLRFADLLLRLESIVEL